MMNVNIRPSETMTVFCRNICTDFFYPNRQIHDGKHMCRPCVFFFYMICLSLDPANHLTALMPVN